MGIWWNKGIYAITPLSPGNTGISASRTYSVPENMYQKVVKQVFTNIMSKLNPILNMNIPGIADKPFTTFLIL